MRNFTLLLWLLPVMMVGSDLEAQTVTIHSRTTDGSGTVTASNKNTASGTTINIGPTAFSNPNGTRVWCVFDLSAVPAGAQVNTADIIFTTPSGSNVYGTGRRVYGVAGDQSGATAATLFGYATNPPAVPFSGTFQYAANPGNATVPLNQDGINFLNANPGGYVTVVISDGTHTGLSGNINGGTHNNRPRLAISYTTSGGGGTVPAPTITSNNSPVCVGGTIILTASSTAPSPVFNWTGPGYSGTGATMSIPNATPANAGVYSVTVTSGGNTSSPVTTTVTVGAAVTPAVTITAQPSGAICPGVPVTFTATPANGGTAPSYQWKKDGQNTGTGSASYTDASLNNGDVITCELTSSAGCATPATATSNAITAVVNPGPQQPLITVSGDTLTSSEATGNQWFRNNIVISGATAQHYVTQTPGWYQVQVTASGCSRRSDSVYYTPGSTGVDERTLRESVSVYPSPFTRNIIVDIQGDIALQADVYIVSELGQTVYRGVLRAGKNELALPSLPGGVYFLLIQDSKGNRATMRLVRI